MKIKSKPVVLVSPLDWGIGHASRCIPVIAKLIESGFEVILGGSGKSGELISGYFPGASYINLPSFKTMYGRRYVFLHLLLQLPFFLFAAIKEHYLLKKLIKKHHIKIVISDNRYGLWNKDIYSIIITHQLFIRLPKYLCFVQRFLWGTTKLMIQKFNECWIPDLPEKANSLSCELSHGQRMPENFRYIGILSRFYKLNQGKVSSLKDKNDLLIILSGPEPQRTIFENILISQARQLKIKTTLLRGLPGNLHETETIGNITFHNHLDDDGFSALVNQSANIICRSGYSTIMDLVSLKKPALLVPTPGQTEQEYLAKYLALKRQFLYQSQKNFNLTKAIQSLNNAKITSFDTYRPNSHLLDEAITNLGYIANKQMKPLSVRENIPHIPGQHYEH